VVGDSKRSGNDARSYYSFRLSENSSLLEIVSGGMEVVADAVLTASANSFVSFLPLYQRRRDADNSRAGTRPIAAFSACGVDEKLLASALIEAGYVAISKEEVKQRIYASQAAVIKIPLAVLNKPNITFLNFVGMFPSLQPFLHFPTWSLTYLNAHWLVIPAKPNYIYTHPELNLTSTPFIDPISNTPELWESDLGPFKVQQLHKCLRDVHMTIDLLFFLDGIITHSLSNVQPVTKKAKVETIELSDSDDNNSSRKESLQILSQRQEQHEAAIQKEDEKAAKEEEERAKDSIVVRGKPLEKQSALFEQMKVTTWQKYEGRKNKRSGAEEEE
jgi:hypothetical protein